MGFFFFRINPLNGDSDHTPFEYYLGVPSVSPMYTFNPKVSKTTMDSFFLFFNINHVYSSVTSNLSFYLTSLDCCQCFCI